MITPDWPAPARVRALITLRAGGHSTPPYQSFNLAYHVGDSPERVAANRQQLADTTGVSRWQWLDQVHGTEVITASDSGAIARADGAYTQATGLALAILTADCLPILLCDASGTQVAALHAGWRGLANGIVAAGLRAFSRPTQDIFAYLGPCISQAAFEVGPEVRQAFLALAQTYRADWRHAFQPSDRPNHWLADLTTLAREHLRACGVRQIYGGGYCTYGDTKRFYSFRRDGITGRMASVIWLDPAI